MYNSEGKAGSSSESAEVAHLREQLRLSIEDLLDHPDVPQQVKESLSGILLRENRLPQLIIK